MTSLVDLGVTASMPEVDSAMRAAFEDVFGLTVQALGSVRKATIEAVPSMSSPTS